MLVKATLHSGQSVRYSDQLVIQLTQNWCLQSGSSADRSDGLRAAEIREYLTITDATLLRFETSGCLSCLLLAILVGNLHEVTHRYLCLLDIHIYEHTVVVVDQRMVASCWSDRSSSTAPQSSLLL